MSLPLIALIRMRKHVLEAHLAENATEARKHMRRATFEALSQAGDTTIRAVLAELKLPGMGALVDKLAAKTLGWAISSSLGMGSGDVFQIIRHAILDPKTNAHEDKRSASGYAYGHSTYFPNNHVPPSSLLAAITRAILAYDPKEITPMSNAISNSAEVVLALITQPDAFTGKRKVNYTTYIEHEADRVGKEMAMSPEEIIAVGSLATLATLGSSVELDRAIERGQATPLYQKLAAKDDAAPAAKEEEEEVTVDDVLAGVIGTLLGKATSGKITDVKATLKELRELRVEVNVLKAKAAAMPTIHIAAKTGSDVVDGNELTYEMVMRNVGELFPHPKTGRKLKQLDFEVPTLVWKAKDGTVVDHPDLNCGDPIDPNYQFKAKDVMRLATAFLLGKNVWTHGHSGAGKTTLHAMFFSRLGIPTYRLNLDSSLERSDLIGTETLAEEGGATVSKFREGILPQAMVKPCVLILDEIDYGMPQILAAIQRALEGRGLLLTEDGGRLVRQHELFRFAATANSRGQGDEFGVYPGVRPLNAAMLDRFGMMVEIEYMDAEAEKELLTKSFSGIGEKFVAQLVSFAGMIRAAFVNGEISTTLSPRGTLAIAGFYTFHAGRLGEETARNEAIQWVVIDRATADNRQRVLELASRAFS